MACFVAMTISILSQVFAGLRIKAETRDINTRRRLITDIVAARHAEAQQRLGPGGIPVRVPGQPTQHIQNLERQQAEMSKRPRTGTVLYAVQSLLSAFIMLILMTFNGFLIGACVLGSAIGYHYFGRASDTLCH